VSLVAFVEEEQVEAFGHKLTLRLDFRAITTIEGALNMPMPLVSAHIRSGAPGVGLLAQVIWAMLREHNAHVTHDEALSIVMDKSNDGAKVGFALDALLERVFPLPKEDRKPSDPRKRHGRSKSSADAG
jgi:hypothetical protein